jgi:Flp pilus assembly pilin Flp
MIALVAFLLMKPSAIRSMCSMALFFSQNEGRWMGLETHFHLRMDKGVTVVEYAIMLALIAIAVAVAAPNITSAVLGVFSKASSVIQ